MTERIQLTLTKMAHGGPAMGHFEGKVVFVPYTLPGETAIVEITTQKKGWCRAQLIEIVEPGPGRVEPRCPHFGPHACGGCQWQHISYEAQLAFKSEVVRDQLARLGDLHDVPVNSTRTVGEAWGYRNHVQLHPVPGTTAGLGYVGADDRHVEAIHTCPIMHCLVAELFEELEIETADLVRLGIRAGVNTNQQMVTFETRDDGAFELVVDRPVSCVLLRRDGSRVTMVGRDYLTERVGDRDYRYSADSFFQVNTAGAEVLLETVTEYLSPRPHHTLLDLYAGVGLFSLAMADLVGQVICVEAYPSAAVDAYLNVQSAGVDNVEVVEGDVEKILEQVEQPAHLVIVDPPRTGCGPRVIQRLADIRPERLVYVACDPAALARDARALAQVGYNLSQVQPLDLFPQTYHVESVALFVCH